MNKNNLKTYTIKEAAEEVGVSSSTIYRMIDHGEIVSIGKVTRWRRISIPELEKLRRLVADRKSSCMGHLTTSEVAAETGMPVTAIGEWIRSGELKASSIEGRTGKGSRYLVKREDLERLILGADAEPQGAQPSGSNGSPDGFGLMSHDKLWSPLEQEEAMVTRHREALEAAIRKLAATYAAAKAELGTELAKALGIDPPSSA